MRLSLTLVDGRNGRPVDALVDFDTSQPVGDLVPALVRLLGEQVHDSFARRVPVWVDGEEVEPQTPAGAAGVHSGAVLSLFEPADRVARTAPAGVAELRVVSGPGAGRIHRLPLGETVVGNGATGWSLPDLRLPSKALTLAVGADGSVTVTPASGFAVELDGTEVEEGGADWPVGGYLAAGGTVLVRAEVGEPAADVEARPDEALVDFNRPPRMLPPDRERSFHLPDPPQELRKRPIPWVMVVVPLVVAMPMAYIFGPRMLVFALLSPVMILANFFSDRKNNRKDVKERQQKYDETLASVTERIEAGLLAEQAERRLSCPDPATMLMQAIGPGARLWERRHNDPDYLRLRVGLGELPASIKVEERRDKTDAEAAPRTLDLVPVWLDVQQLGVVGVAGDLETAPPIAHWMVAQAALLHSPRDVRITVLSDAEGESDWSWVRWLPHARIGGDPEALALGTQQDSVGRRLAELTALVEQRQANIRDKVRATPDVLVVLDGARRLRTLPAVVDLLRRGPAVGVMVLCVEDEVRQLPEECRAVVACAAGEIRIQETASEGTAGITPDLVEVPWCETVARALSPLRDTTPEEEATGLPASARLLEEIRLDPPTPEGIAPRWLRGRTTEVVVGAGYDGPFRIDLRRDGPHALIAGTTGSGKSEFLQTLVASLAVANRPDELTFVLVDYKGGSAFKDCARLPHTVGMVTDLDNHLVGRALVSLAAELRRREHLLAVPGAKDLEDYWALQRSQPDLPAIPRLVLVIDEFASMVAELPDFVSGLVSIAQRGRSLGIHLVLATQRPSGVVSADIRANTNLRISLRVTDENDSRDVIDAPDAARIQKNQPGRAFVRSGASTLMPFQSGRVGGRSPDADQGPKEAPEALAWPLPWERVGLPAPARPKQESVQTDEADTDLAAVVDAIGTLNASLSIPPQHRPWLDALPDLVQVADLPAFAVPDTGEHLAAAWALEDLPALQEQRAKTFELGRDGHLYVIGGPRSGRSTAMRTIAGALADEVGVEDLHVYGLDCGNGALLGLSNLPHTGAVVSRTQVDRAGRLLSRLVSVVEERQAMLGAGGYADLAELRAARPDGEKPPYLLFLLDRWDGFVSSLGEVDSGRMTDQVMALLRDGTSVGLHVVLSGDRTLVTGRMSTLVDNRVVLRLSDRADFGAVGIPPKEVPDTLVDGRALTPDPVVESQVAVLSSDISGAGQNTALRDIAARHADRDAAVPRERRPFRLEEMPAVAPLDDAVLAALAAQADRIAAGVIPVGLGGDDLLPVGLDLSGTAVAVLAGPPKAGRTNTLRFVARAVRAAGQPVLALCPMANALSRDLGDDALLTDGLEEADLVERFRSLPEGTVVLVDDAEMLKEGPLSQALLALVQQARGKKWRVLVAGATAEVGAGYSGWIYEARKSRQGFLMSPQGMADGDIFSARLMRSSLVPRVHPGRGLVIDPGGGQVQVQVPLVE
ncbi:FtsK/SpoIIIE domain-containing protein [Nocardioides iriomotensis]|uniref:Cell division protein FtsK n=1 Tax=Nocardioides iriomotensis TaxID=715784 RepID=A0A4Q5J319_9ACTN|nr:FtsK/SpoIIIE domain-containing protein [Nocardioides iriomotensis]RYU12763.1 cell division protein FtsK [Nocardioides iriomotensis]